MAKARATGQGDMAARNFPRAIWRRLAGVSRCVSSVPRSRSPLKLSAAMMRQMNRPTAMEALTISRIISRSGSRLTSALEASRYE